MPPVLTMLALGPETCRSTMWTTLAATLWWIDAAQRKTMRSSMVFPSLSSDGFNNHSDSTPGIPRAARVSAAVACFLAGDQTMSLTQFSPGVSAFDLFAFCTSILPLCIYCADILTAGHVQMAKS